MDANREPKGPREAPTGSEAGEHREGAMGGSAPCSRGTGEDVFVLSGGESPRGWYYRCRRLPRTTRTICGSMRRTN